MRNILILTPFFTPNIGGAETFIDQLTKEASKWFQITVLTFMPFRGKASSFQESYTKNGSLKVFRMRWLIRPPKVWKGVSLTNMLLVFPKMALCSFLLCLKNKFEIVHSQGLLSGLVGVFIAKIFHCKHYMTLLALYKFKEWSGIKRLVAKYIFNNCHIIFVEGENGKKDIKWISQEPDKIRIFTHWCDQKVFKPDPNRLNDKIRVLYIGRPIPEKGMHIVQAAERVLNNPKYEFTYVTNAKHSDLPKIYQRHHILVVPSQYDEGHTRVVVEGASCGCAVITSDRGSLPEQVREFGTVVGSPLAWEATIRNITKSNEDLALLYARNHFSNENAEVFLNAYTYD